VNYTLNLRELSYLNTDPLQTKRYNTIYIRLCNIYYFTEEDSNVQSKRLKYTAFN